MDQSTYIIHNGTVLTSHRMIPNGGILVVNGLIEEVFEGAGSYPKDIHKIDAGGQYISPGFIDIHVHGGGDSDFMDGTVEDYLTIANTHASYGTTGMYPTTLSGKWEDFINALDVYEESDEQNTAGAEFLGLHVEGPYLAMSQKGAQDPRYIRNPDPEEYEFIIREYPFVKRWSIAPELPGAMEFGAFMRKHGVLPAIAHTDAVYEDVVRAHEVGYTLATHFYSAMSTVTRRNAFRYAGSIEATYLLDAMDVEIIGDGIHLPAPLLQYILKVKGTDRTALITDAMRAAGMPEGPSVLGTKGDGLEVIVEGGVAKLLDRSSFAGSVATMDRTVRTIMKKANVTLVEAVKMASLVPARIMKIDHQKGSITPKKDADIILFDQDIRVSKTIVKGKVVYDG
ncbi:N-acetylglucosamine-6-phosphate deacetylase [Membranicola marinus]|uniref:N-acetylglucosamine-6-phosphate deacetylase n=1 Tax=Membranihabitans marinus TaxID=1227546 RepID=A0A953HV05_9BACT|nr:N-acetylglucosamine-6-phosphate deacetylase [Membranihabitans marinus]MBY5958701.1 N-acetylglucosamine-6-phosphate deacetylase [Membranihabitans marinus]